MAHAVAISESRSAVFELRLVREKRAEYAAPGGEIVSNPREFARLFRPYFAGLDREHFLVAPVDTKHRLLGFHVVSIGALGASIVHPRETFKAAILASAHAIILAHNHPSGDPTPSAEDRAVTRRLQAAGEILGIPILDHIVFGDGDRIYSFTEMGVL